MGNERRESVIARAFRASLLILATMIALNLAVAYLRSVLAWLIAGAATAAVVWALVAIVRWRRSRW